MNVKTIAEIKDLSSTALREYAKEIGVKRSANDTKVSLGAKVMNRVLEIENEQHSARLAGGKSEKSATTAPEEIAAPKTPKRICNVCNKRRIGTGGGDQDGKTLGMCNPCATEGGWENAHNDEGHEDANSGEPRVEACWICHPELNQASDDYVARKGSSKAGMKILAKGSYIHKSEMVKAAIEALGGDVHVNTSKSGVTRLTANVNNIVVQAQWIGNAWDYAGSEGINGKKVRNVKELLRKMGVEAAKI